MFIVLSLGLLVTLLIATGCVQQPLIEQGFDASVRSHYPIEAVNDQPAEEPYYAYFHEGAAALTVRFDSYFHQYLCTFHWHTIAGEHYEVRHEDFKEPLVLYHWQRVNALWAERVDPVFPDCEVIPQ